MLVGDWQVDSLETGECWLDGGAMFGSVPKTLWEREHPVDEQNRICLALRCLLIRGHGRTIVVDTGCGDKWSDKLRDIFRLHNPIDSLRDAIRAQGVDPESVTDVILTHLHFDHAGGVSELNEKGELVLTFPRAKHWVQRDNLENAQKPGLRERASYLPENWQPVVEGNHELTVGTVELYPGLSVRPVHGHTRGMQLVRLADKDGRNGLVYGADLIPTRSHVRLPYTMGYDINPGLLIEEKATALRDCLDHDLLVFFEHDPICDAASLKEQGGRIEIADSIRLDDRGADR
ncbi:MAG: MBL fold metallo-hydrolase [Planctomycetota bacterium]